MSAEPAAVAAAKKKRASVVSSTALTPGTEFMHDVNVSLGFYVANRAGQQRWREVRTGRRAWPLCAWLATYCCAASTWPDALTVHQQTPSLPHIPNRCALRCLAAQLQERARSRSWAASRAPGRTCAPARRTVRARALAPAWRGVGGAA